MNKSDLVNAVMEIEGLKITKKGAVEIINTVLDKIKDALSTGNKVQLVGFGTFSVVKRKARQGRNPRTGKKIKIPARKVPKFSASKELKKAC